MSKVATQFPRFFSGWQSRRDWKEKKPSKRCLDHFEIFLAIMTISCENSRDLDEHTHRILLWLTAVMRFCLEAGELWRKIFRLLVMVMPGYSFKTTPIKLIELLRITISHLLIVVPDSIIINYETHEEKWRHYSVKDDFPGSNLKERMRALLRQLTIQG